MTSKPCIGPHKPTNADAVGGARALLRLPLTIRSRPDTALPVEGEVYRLPKREQVVHFPNLRSPIQHSPSARDAPAGGPIII